MAQRHYYAIHRWLGAIAGVQLLLWSVSGLIFATHDIDAVRGTVGRAEQTPAALALDRVRLTPAEAIARAGLEGVEQAVLRPFLDAIVYELQPVEGAVTLVDASDGKVLSPIDEDSARRIAREDRAAAPAVTAASLVTADPPVEYRERPLPAWRVDLADDDGTRIWVDARSGTITARRNDAWRRFDFFWMLHTMDYEDRDDFNHSALIIFAISSILTVLSGGALWFIRVRRRWTRRRS